MTRDHFLDLIFQEVLAQLNKIVDWIAVNIFHATAHEE